MSDGHDGPIHDFIKKVVENITNVPDRVKNACPKCGSELEPAVRSGDSLEVVRLTCFNCGHEEKVKQ